MGCTICKIVICEPFELDYISEEGNDLLNNAERGKCRKKIENQLTNFIALFIIEIF